MSSARPDRLITEHPLEGETMTPATDEPTATSIPELRAALSGRVITPDDAGYDDARRVFSGEFDRRPAAIARVADDADVARVVGFARETGWSSPFGAAATAAPDTAPRTEGSCSTSGT
jgi:hypothetical protein